MHLIRDSTYGRRETKLNVEVIWILIPSVIIVSVFLRQYHVLCYFCIVSRDRPKTVMNISLHIFLIQKIKTQLWVTEVGIH